MTPAPNAPSTHCPADETLLCWLDGELDPSERDVLRAHVDSCSVCADTVRSMQARNERLSAWLVRHDPEVPGRSAYDLSPRTRTPRRHVRWAAAASVVLAVGVAAGPARAWLLARLGFGSPGTEEIADAPAPALTTATAFVPRGSTVTVAFDAGVKGRTLAVTRAADNRAALDAAESAAEVVVGPDRFDVHDAGQAPLAYRLTVPATVTTVRVHVAGAADVVVRPDSTVHVVGIPTGGR